MPTFHDADQRAWTYSLTVSAVKRIKTAMNVDLTAPETSTTIIDEPLTMADIFWHLIRQDAERRGITYDAFIDAMPPHIVENAIPDFLTEWASFFPKPPDPRRHLLTALPALRETLKTQAIAKIDRELAKLSGRPSTASPDTLESTPAPTPSVKSSG